MCVSTQQLGGVWEHVPLGKLNALRLLPKAVFGPKQPLEYFVQYSDRRLAARQERASQAKCKHHISCHLVATTF